MKHAVKRGALALALATSALATPFSTPGVSANETLPASTVLKLSNLKVVGTPQTPTPGITRTEYSGLDGAGPWKVNVVVIDPDLASVNLKGTFGTGLGTSQKTTEMLDGLTTTNVRKPLVGINGGFFDGNVKSPAGTWDGDLNGVVIQGGKLLSEAVRGKGGKPVSTSLVLQHGRPYITELSTTLTINPKGSPGVSRTLDGINRAPGRASHCERPAPGDTDETQNTDKVCIDTSEIISFTKEYGAPTPTAGLIVVPNDPDAAVPPKTEWVSVDKGFEVHLDATETVTECFDSQKEAVTGSGCTTEDRGGNSVPPGGRILQGIGEGADWLRAHTKVGGGFDLPETVTDTRFNDILTLDPSMYVTAGGDLLLRNGHIEFTDPAGGGDKDPRTAVGTDHYGRTVLVTVDGGGDRSSIGATRGELATFMQELKVLDAVNMDGGGSTTLVWQQALANTPTDGNGRERPVGDTVYAGPGGYPRV
ncbi:phosphodiester glycosidase family protein [Streptomyces sp. NPDC051546]|uniref:phosphodiester glycosidase family protein n=1 Tax=Streptomyces sp. NPDC051546 TaxID=3365655 RepID=UPI00378EC098